MRSVAYKLSKSDTILAHNRAQSLMLRDSAEDRALEIDAAVHSGDYFVTLATILEMVADEFGKADPQARIMLDKLIKDLDYVQRRYVIVKKSSGDAAQ